MAAQLVLERYGHCDVFVHCAGAFDVTNLAEFDLAAWRYVLAVHVEAARWLARAFAPGMAERGFGRVVFITSDTFWDPSRPAAEGEPAPRPYIARVRSASQAVHQFGPNPARHPTVRQVPGPAPGFVAVVRQFVK